MSYPSLFVLFVQSDPESFNKIYETRFYSEATTHFDFSIHSFPAFFFQHNEINVLLTQLRKYDRKINEIFDYLPGVFKDQYIKKSLIDEIQFTNEIEGVLPTRKDIFNILEDIEKNGKEKRRLEGIVKKYQLLMDKKNLKFTSSEDVRNLYDEMLYHEIEADDPKKLPDGRIFRSGAVYVTRSDEKIIHEGVFPESNIIEMMNRALNVLNDQNMDLYIRVAVFHYLFAYIHPFYDGNGRTARFISSYSLLEECTPILAYRLSMTIKENLSQYLEAFKRTNDARNRGDLSTFVYEFLDIILTAYQKTELYALEKKQLLEEYRKKMDVINLTAKEKSALFVLIQCALFHGYGMSCTELGEIIHFGKTKCRETLDQLFKKGWIEKKFIGKWIYYSAILEKIDRL